MVEGLYPYDPKYGQIIQSDVPGVHPDRAFLAHLVLENPAAASVDGIGKINMGAEVQEITEGINKPDYPRALSIKGNVSGIAGNIEITGTNYAGEVITEILAANGTTAKHGNKAFATVIKVKLPIQAHTPAAQTETITVTAACATAGDITVAVTAAALGDDSPVSVTVPVVTVMDDVTKVATAIVAALNNNEVISAAFTASNEAGIITLAAKEPAANDGDLTIAVTAGDTGITAGASTNGTAGVPYDIISIGWNDKIGLPYLLAHNTVLAAHLNNVLEVNAPTVTTSAAAVESNTIDLSSTLNGKRVDVYLMV